MNALHCLQTVREILYHHAEFGRSMHNPAEYVKNKNIHTRDIRKVTPVYFIPLMYEWGWARACELASQDSLPCKPSQNRSPSICTCFYRVRYGVSWIENPASCGIQALIRFFHANSINAAEIHCELWAAVYGQNVTSEKNRQWCRMLKNWQQMFTMKSEVVGRPFVVSADLVQVLIKKFVKKALHNFITLIWISTNFVHCPLRDYHSYAILSQVLRRLVSENVHGYAQNA
jgi:hypothetical protein